MNIETQFVNYKEFPQFDLQKSLSQQFFLSMLKKEVIEDGELLEIGAGQGLNPFLCKAFGEQAVIDGVDIDPSVLDNPYLRNRWHAPFETADIPVRHYQLAMTCNVVEHISAARPFFEKLVDVLRPGGIFWAYTPYAWHPSAILSRAIENVGLKGFFARRSEGVNDYPAYYRLNSVGRVKAAIRGLPFESARFYFMFAPGWKYYFPKRLRFIPEAWDAATMQRSTAILAYRLQLKSE